MVIAFPSNGLNTTGEENTAFSAKSLSNNSGSSPLTTSCHLWINSFAVFIIDS